MEKRHSLTLMTAIMCLFLFLLPLSGCVKLAAYGTIKGVEAIRGEKFYPDKEKEEKPLGLLQRPGTEKKFYHNDRRRKF